MNKPPLITVIVAWAIMIATVLYGAAALFTWGAPVAEAGPPCLECSTLTLEQRVEAIEAWIIQHEQCFRCDPGEAEPFPIDLDGDLNELYVAPASNPLDRPEGGR